MLLYLIKLYEMSFQRITFYAKWVSLPKKFNWTTQHIIPLHLMVHNLIELIKTKFYFIVSHLIISNYIKCCIKMGNKGFEPLLRGFLLLNPNHES